MTRAMVSFDFVQFSKNIINTIDSFRVRKSESEVMVQNNPAAEVGFEPRTNAFLRMMGFQKYYIYVKKNQPDNIMEGYVNNRFYAFVDRVEKTIENKNLTNNQKIIQSLNTIYNPYNPSPEQRLILPFVWNGNMLIPEERRIAEPFEREQVKTKAPRCLLEAIIEMRVNRMDPNYISSDIKEYFAEGLGLDIKDYTAITLRILSNFDQIIKRLAEFHAKIIHELGRLKKEINYFPAQLVDGLPQSKANNKSEDFTVSDLSKQNEVLKLLRAEENILLSNSSLLFDRYAVPGVDATNKEYNLTKDYVLMPSVISVLNADLDRVQREIKETENNIAEFSQRMESVRMSMDFFYGTSSGISIVDVLCTIWALFLIDVETLLGLLNDDQFENYQKFKEDRKIQNDYGSDRPNIVTAYNTLEKKFKELIGYYKDVVADVAKPKKSDFSLRRSVGKK